jgi:hypothetical protein
VHHTHTDAVIHLLPSIRPQARRSAKRAESPLHTPAPSAPHAQSGRQPLSYAAATFVPRGYEERGGQTAQHRGVPGSQVTSAHDQRTDSRSAAAPASVPGGGGERSEQHAQHHNMRDGNSASSREQRADSRDSAAPVFAPSNAESNAHYTATCHSIETRTRTASDPSTGTQGTSRRVSSCPHIDRAERLRTQRTTP